MKDLIIKDKIDQNKNMAVPFYLMMAYAYYVQDAPFASDNCFDETAKFILDNWDEIEHRHKSYLTKDALKAGTFLGKYPSIVEGAVDSFEGIDKL